jgi:polyhydroxyalkanoate synthase subunit PhaC
VIEYDVAVQHLSQHHNLSPTVPCQSAAIMSKVSSKDKELFRIPGGHIGIMAGSGAGKRTWLHIEGWLAPRSE